MLTLLAHANALVFDLFKSGFFFFFRFFVLRPNPFVASQSRRADRDARRVAVLSK